jgi:hypothetical protein
MNSKSYEHSIRDVGDIVGYSGDYCDDMWHAVCIRPH